MKVNIEFEIDSKDRQIVEVFPSKWTHPIRTSRYLVPGTWNIKVS